MIYSDFAVKSKREKTHTLYTVYIYIIHVCVCVSANLGFEMHTVGYGDTRQGYDDAYTKRITWGLLRNKVQYTLGKKGKQVEFGDAPFLDKPI